MKMYALQKNEANRALCFFFTATPYLPSLMMRIPDMRLLVVELFSLALLVLGIIALTLYLTAWEHLLDEKRDPLVWVYAFALPLSAFLCFLTGATTLLGTFQYSKPYEGFQMMAPWCSLIANCMMVLQIWKTRNKK
jgi:hypothetical protein